MGPELEEAGNQIFDNKIPAIWLKRSYPSMKPLASYIKDLVERLEFIEKWVNEGAPPAFWMSGFFFTQSFMTGLKQNYARKYVIAIDQVTFGFEIISDPQKIDTNVAPEDGGYIYGLFLEGCRWDAGLEVLAESHSKVLFTKMPHIWMKPGKMSDMDYGHSYKCPVYKTVERRGTLTTTGHSSNFVLDTYLPMQRRHNTAHWTKRGVALITQLSD